MLSVLFVDAKKAIDRVELEILLNVLEAMKIGPFIQLWFMLIYTKQVAFIGIVGYNVEKIKICGSVRQGCPLSPLLFL